MTDTEKENSWGVEHVPSQKDPGGSQRDDHALKLDPRGLPLSPQPSDDPMDPLNWKPWLKFMVLIQVSILSFLALLSASLIVRHALRVPLHKCLYHRHCCYVRYANVMLTLDSCLYASISVSQPRPRLDCLCDKHIHPLRRCVGYFLESHF